MTDIITKPQIYQTKTKLTLIKKISKNTVQIYALINKNFEI